MKRKNGEGSVYKMKNGKYRASVMIGYRSDGKPICKEFKRSTRKEAERALRDFISDKNKKISFGKTATVNELANEWLYNVKKYEVRPTSFDRLESTYKTHIEKGFGFMQVSAVTARDVQKLMNKCSKRLTYNSATKVYKLLRALFDWNITSPDYETRIRTDNPCAGVKLRRENCVASRKNVKYFSDEEIEKITKECKRKTPNGKYAHSFGLLYVLMLNTGLRVSEAIALKKSDIDLTNRVITVSKNLTTQALRDESGRKIGYYTVENNTTKTKNSNRVVALNDEAFACATSLITQNFQSEYLAVTHSGCRISPQNAEKTFRNIQKSAGVELLGRNTHALRHTFASRLFSLNVDAKQISLLLGHSSASFTIDTYIDIINRQRNGADAVAKLNSY